MKRNFMIQRILSVYPGWLDIYSYSDIRIRAIYHSMLERGKFDKKKSKKKDIFKQLTIFDIFTPEQIGGNVNGK